MRSLTIVVCSVYNILEHVSPVDHSIFTILQSRRDIPFQTPHKTLDGVVAIVIRQFVYNFAPKFFICSSFTVFIMLTSNRLLLKGQQNQRATRPKIKEEK